MNAETLKLDAAEAAAESPALGLPRPGAEVDGWVGDDERPEFVRQATLLANVWTGARRRHGADDRAAAAPFRRDRRPGPSPFGSGRGARRGRGGMRSRARVVVIGGGVVGCSVLFHLARAGWTDAMLIERSELTSGSSWHAAGGFHTLNGDPNVAKLQAYTVGLYEELEEVSGPVLRAAPDRRGDDGRQPGAHGLPAAHPRQGPLPRDGNRDHHARRGGGDVPADGPEPFRRRALGPGRGASRPGRDDARLRQGGAGARGDDRAAQPGGRADPGGRTAPGTSSPSTGRSRPSMWSTPAASGRARSGAWSGSSCRCWRWSTCIC